jgi:hypothetical protein
LTTTLPVNQKVATMGPFRFVERWCVSGNCEILSIPAYFGIAKLFSHRPIVSSEWLMSPQGARYTERHDRFSNK